MHEKTIREGPKQDKKIGFRSSVYFNAEIAMQVEELCKKYNTNVNHLLNCLVNAQYKEDFKC